MSVYCASRNNQQPTTNLNKSYKYILVFVILLGFALRLKICNELLCADPNVLFPSHLTDMATFKTLALQIAQGTYWKPFYFQPFYYVVFLAGIFKILGANIYYVLISQSFLGALTILFTALSAQILWDKKTAIIAAFLILLSQTLNFYTPFMLIVTLQSFWISLLLYMTLVAFKRKKNVYWIYIGFITGCSILTRGNMWLFVPLLFVMTIGFGIVKQKAGKNFTKRYIIPIIYFLFFMILPQIPFIFINTQILQKLSEPSTVAGAALSYGNTPESPPTANSPEFGAGVIAMNPTQRYWLDNIDKISITGRIIHFIKQKPLSYIELTFRKFLLFWDYREIPNNVDINTESQLSPSLKYLCFITTAILMVLAIPCILIFLPFFPTGRRKYLIPLSFILTYWASISLVKVLARYRAPLIPIMTIYAAGFIYFIFFKTINIRKILIGIILLSFSIFIVFFSYDMYRYNLESKVIKLVNPNGISVDMGNKTMYLDNGPMIFGSWTPKQLQSDDILTKTFIVNDSNMPSNGTIHIPFIAMDPIKATIEINNKLFHFTTDTPGKLTKDFNIPIKYTALDKAEKSVKIMIHVKKLSGRLFYILDYQRDFNRTNINDKTVNAELVCRLYLK